MLICMRTTLNLPDALVEEAKRRALSQGRTLTSLVEEGLHAVLATAESAPAVALPRHGSGTGRVLVDLLDRDAVEAALDGSSP
jgi:hypothetical protein